MKLTWQLCAVRCAKMASVSGVWRLFVPLSSGNDVMNDTAVICVCLLCYSYSCENMWVFKYSRWLCCSSHQLLMRKHRQSRKHSMLTEIPRGWLPKNSLFQIAAQYWYSIQLVWCVAQGKCCDIAMWYGGAVHSSRYMVLIGCLWMFEFSSGVRNNRSKPNCLTRCSKHNSWEFFFHVTSRNKPTNPLLLLFLYFIVKLGT